MISKFISKNIKFSFFTVFMVFISSCNATNIEDRIIVGAEQTEKYLQFIEGKNIAVIVNQTSVVNQKHLVDFLIEKNIKIKTIFAPEHGFRGEAANGEEIVSSIDVRTNIPIVSLYGNKKKALPEDLENIDIVIFDIQDVGCRFYTYISTMFYMMEACAENNVDLLILDRPNPNGDYVAGPVLDMELSSFVGIIPIPIVHGCTVGELAQMINGENWLHTKIKCKTKIVPVKNYNHKKEYTLPIKPSPNLPNQLSIRLYPSLCFFEATNVSIGRGTSTPFQIIGYPNSAIDSFEFIPKAIEGVSKYPLHENQICKGVNLSALVKAPQFSLSYFIQFFNSFNDSKDFWKSERWIDLLSGDGEFYEKINKGWSEEQIKESWQADLDLYKQMRKPYLLYPDFE